VIIPPSLEPYNPNVSLEIITFFDTHNTEYKFRKANSVGFRYARPLTKDEIDKHTLGL